MTVLFTKHGERLMPFIKSIDYKIIITALITCRYDKCNFKNVLHVTLFAGKIRENKETYRSKTLNINLD